MSSIGVAGVAASGPAGVLNFWFGEVDPTQWYQASDALDAEVKRRFQGDHDAARRCELFAWRATPQGRLAEIILLDQFSRNIMRGVADAFSQDALALALAQEAVSAGADALLSPPQRAFLYLPYMHSESRVIQDAALALFESLGAATNLEFARKHMAIIERFGRYPHRNDVLGRQSTAEELAFLETPGSSF